MANVPGNADEIRRRMAQIRRELHEDVQGVVEGAEAATDWRRYVRSYPLATMGLALAVGYLVVPRRHRATPALPSAIASGPVQYVAAEAEPAKKKGKGLLGTAFGLIAPVALRAAQGYALQFFEQWMAQKMAQQLQNHPDLAAAFGGQPEPPPRGAQGRPPGAARF